MLVTFFLLYLFQLCTTEYTCNLPQEIKKEIKDHKSVVTQIINYVVDDNAYTGRAYKDLSDFVHQYNHRVPGTSTLELAINETIRREKASQLEVSTHSFSFRPWKRSLESAEIIEPKREKLTIFSLTNSGNTSSAGLIAPLIVISNFIDLEAKKDKIPGSIVLFNAIETTYEKSRPYQIEGPDKARKFGAVGVLVRAVTNVLKSGPHAGYTIFSDQSIPAAVISIEDAKKLAKMAKNSNDKVKINLRIESRYEDSTTTRNIIADIRGDGTKDEYVVLLGQIDSYDVGQGVLDNAGGAFTAYHALSLLKFLHLQPPKRNIRAVLFSGQTQGNLGSKAYKNDREYDVRKWAIGLQSNFGVFRNLGLVFSGTANTTCIIFEILKLLKSIKATSVISTSSAGQFKEFNDMQIPFGEAYVDTNTYFNYYNTRNDIINKIKTTDMDQNVAFFAAVSYVLANLSFPIPKGPSASLMEYQHEWGKSTSNNLQTCPLLLFTMLLVFIFQHKL